MDDVVVHLGVSTKPGRAELREFAGARWWLSQRAKDIPRKSQLARTLYHSSYREMVRGLQVVSGVRGRVTGE